jgi:hypothetical protein
MQLYKIERYIHIIYAYVMILLSQIFQERINLQHHSNEICISSEAQFAMDGVQHYVAHFEVHICSNCVLSNLHSSSIVFIALENLAVVYLKCILSLIL